MSERIILKCKECKMYKKILCLKICRPCYFKLYRKFKKKSYIRYGMSEYPL